MEASKQGERSNGGFREVLECGSHEFLEFQNKIEVFLVKLVLGYRVAPSWHHFFKKWTFSAQNNTSLTRKMHQGLRRHHFFFYRKLLSSFNIHAFHQYLLISSQLKIMSIYSQNL